MTKPVFSTEASTQRSPRSSDKRLLRPLRGETLSRPPFWLMRQAGRYLPEYQAVRREAGDFLTLCYTPDLAVEVTLQPLRRYAMDAAIVFADILLIPDALGQPLTYREGEGPVLEPLRSRQDLRSLDAGRLHDHLAPVYETVARLARELPPETALIGFAGAPWTVATYMVEGRSSRDFCATKRWAYGDPEGFGQLINLLVETTSLYLVAQGTQVVAAKKRRFIDPHWLRGNSYLRLGWQWVKTALTRGWELFATLGLSGQPDPEPARASLAHPAKAPPVTFTVTFFYAS